MESISAVIASIGDRSRVAAAAAGLYVVSLLVTGRRIPAAFAAVAFALYPTSLEDLMQVADAGQVMPPKSTWFEPKLRSGMVVQLLTGERL